MTKQQKKTINKEIKKELKELRQLRMQAAGRSGNTSSMNSFTGIAAKVQLYAKTMWLTQAKKLVQLFNVDLTSMVNGLIKINDDYQVDFSFIDKVLTHMVGLKKQELLQALSISNVPNPNTSMLNDQS